MSVTYLKIRYFEMLHLEAFHQFFPDSQGLVVQFNKVYFISVFIIQILRSEFNELFSKRWPNKILFFKFFNIV
jgi:hypothetical protein